MALSKQVATQFGTTAEYWRIAVVVEDYTADTLNVVLSGYVSANARQANAQPLSRADFSLAVNGDTITHDMDRAALYAYIKTLDDWTAAVDC